MKILYFSRSYTPHDFRFLSAIVEGGHRAFFLRSQHSNSSRIPPLPKGTEEVAWSGFLEPVIAQVKPDLVHAGPVPSCGYLAARSGFHPLVLMSWGSDLLWEARRNPFVRLRAKYALPRADVVIGDCDAMRRVAMDYGAHSSRIAVFPWGVDLKSFNPKGGDGGWRARLGWQQNVVLLHLRTWEPLYDPLTVARAFARAARQEPRLRLLMPGAGSLAGKITKVFEQHQVLDRVHFPGQLNHDELPQIFRAADLYLSASLSDGSSVSLMEALASGLPALVSDILGNREWVQPGKEGWLFLAKDDVVLADHILRSVAQPDQLKLMGGLARKTAETRADWAQNKQALYSAYHLALETAG
ncbi:MAG: glycosyltransferase family 4 protein [Anaerolineales bacterium]